MSAMGVPAPRAPLPTAPPFWLPWKPASWSGPECLGLRGPEPPPPGQPPAPDWSSGKHCGAPGSPGGALARAGERGLPRPLSLRSAAPDSWGSPRCSRRPDTPAPPSPRPLQRQPRRRAEAGLAGKVRKGRGARSQHPTRLQTWGGRVAVRPATPGQREAHSWWKEG